jgi:UDP-N-acetyl-D-glucosamine/UDP-N-acetyl-D-galactosamine dehydrogenase
MFQELIDKKEKLAVIGLGYVGLPIALEFARKVSVIGFDINAKRIDMMKQGIDPSNVAYCFLQAFIVVKKTI